MPCRANRHGLTLQKQPTVPLVRFSVPSPTAWLAFSFSASCHGEQKVCKWFPKVFRHGVDVMRRMAAFGNACPCAPIFDAVVVGVKKRSQVRTVVPLPSIATAKTQPGVFTIVDVASEGQSQAQSFFASIGTGVDFVASAMGVFIAWDQVQQFSPLVQGYLAAAHTNGFVPHDSFSHVGQTKDCVGCVQICQCVCQKMFPW